MNGSTISPRQQKRKTEDDHHPSSESKRAHLVAGSSPRRIFYQGVPGAHLLNKLVQDPDTIVPRPQAPDRQPSSSAASPWCLPVYQTSSCAGDPMDVDMDCSPQTVRVTGICGV
ncbi:hypothetical protein HKX48_000102 [Thoreauomyces humboldtii]|nr:hypothetical protein HKX48_000102 [Thoreauomyces humboldtii]